MLFTDEWKEDMVISGTPLLWVLMLLELQWGGWKSMELMSYKCEPSIGKETENLPRDTWSRRTKTVRNRGPFLESPEKPFVKLRPAHSVRLVFWYVVKIMKMKITATFRVSERLHFKIIKRLMSPEKFRDFRETGPRAYNSPISPWTCHWLEYS